MSRIALFRTPISRGMLGGALAGGVLLLHVWFSKSFFGSSDRPWMFYYTIARVLLELTFLFTIPALFSRKPVRFLLALQLGVTAFVILIFVGAYALMPLIIEQVGYGQIVYTAYNAVYLLISGGLLGLANAYVCNQTELRIAGLKWGALGSLFRIVAQVSHETLQSSTEKSALFSMLIAIGLILQGAMASVPFERTLNK